MNFYSGSNRIDMEQGNKRSDNTGMGRKAKDEVMEQVVTIPSDGGAKMVTVKLYSCNECNKTMIVEVFADEATTLAIIKQNPTCNDCTEAETN